MRRLSLQLPLILLCLAMLSFNASGKSKSRRGAETRNIIFMIGDGMGLSAAYAGISVSEKPLNLVQFPTIGLQTTYSANNYITDSAAAGTALSSGKKTKNGAIGVDDQGNPTKSILVMAEEHGLATGMVAITTITDATPASFIAHDPSRGNAENIARDFLKTDIDLFIGGGYNYFAKRSDKLNLIDSLKSRGYEIDTTMAMVTKSTSKKIAGLVYPNAVPYRLKGRGTMLRDGSAKAIEVLSRNPKGFFLMIEGSHIDHGGHDNDAAVLTDEVLDFDQAIGVALEFARKDKHTLVVITSDHETGGVTIVGGDMKAHTVKLNFSSKGHTAALIPVYSFGPGSENFTGFFDNTDFIGKFLACYKFKN